MIMLSFRQTRTELMLRTAATLLFGTLKRCGTPEQPLRDLIKGNQYGHTASASSEPVGPRLVRITDLKDGTIDWENVPYCECTSIDQYKLYIHDVLFARTGATTGKTHLVTNLPKEPAVFASYLIRVRPKEDLDPGYLAAFFMSDLYWEQIVEQKEGSAQANVNGDKLSRLMVPVADRKSQRQLAEFIAAIHQRSQGVVIELPVLPSPLSEQRQLFERIDALARKIEEANRLRGDIDVERGALEASFTNSIFTDGQGQDCQLRPLGELAEIQSGVTLGRTLTGPSVRKPYLRVANVQDGHFNLSVIKEIEIRPDEFPKWKLVPGDLLLTEGGDWDKLGRGSVWKGEIPDCIHQNHIFRVRVDSIVLDPEYLAILTASPYGKEYFCTF